MGGVDTGDHKVALRKTAEVTDARTWRMSKRGAVVESQMVQNSQSRLGF